MNCRMILTSIFLAAMLLWTTPVAFPQSGSTADIVAYYKDMKVIVYDKVRGVYGRDYSYDWDANKYTFFKNYTTSPAPLPTDIDSRKVTILDGKLEDVVWQEIKPVIVNLEPTHPWGGAIKRVSVRAANNGTWLFMAFEWEDTTESQYDSPKLKHPEGGFFYNQTYFYSDVLFIGWWMKDGQATVKPWFNSYFAGTTAGRVPWRLVDPSAEANLWLFRANWGDDDSPAWPVYYLEALRTFKWGRHVGEPVVYPYPWIPQTFLNSTANYFLGTGVIHVSGCAFPGKETFPFEVYGNGLWEHGVWTLEVARPLKTHRLNEPVEATMKFESSGAYWVFFGAADGHHGETEDVGSISQWFALYIEPAPSPAIPAALFVGVFVAVVAGMVGALALWRSRSARHRIETARTPP